MCIRDSIYTKARWRHVVFLHTKGANLTITIISMNSFSRNTEHFQQFFRHALFDEETNLPGRGSNTDAWKTDHQLVQLHPDHFQTVSLFQLLEGLYSSRDKRMHTQNPDFSYDENNLLLYPFQNKSEADQPQ